MKEVGLYQAKTTLSALVAEIEKDGKPIALTRHGRVVAELRAPSSISPKAGMLKSPGFSIAPDFDEIDMGFHDLCEEPATRVAEDETPHSRRSKP